MHGIGIEAANALAERVEEFVRKLVIPYELDPSCSEHGPSEELIAELRAKAREAELMTPHIQADGAHLSQRETALVPIKSGLSPLGPVALNTMGPDEENIYDGPTEVHKWSLAKKIKRDHAAGSAA